MHRLSALLIIMTMYSNTATASDEPLDVAFLEWLGETAEVEELGMDIDKLIESKEDSAQQPEENSQ